MTAREQLDSGEVVYQDDITLCSQASVSYHSNNETGMQYTVTNEFAVAVCSLPTTIADATNMEKYYQFLDSWGTVRNEGM